MDQTIFETKRKLVIQILQKLQDVWKLAPWFLIIVQSEYLTETVLDTLADVLQRSIASVSSELEQAKLQQALTLVQKIQHREQESREQDIQDLERMMDEIESL